MAKKVKAGHLGGNVIGGDPKTFYPELWDWLIKEFGIKSVLDVGCGEGHALEYFKNQRCDVLGIDGFYGNTAITKTKGIPATIVDLTVLPYKTTRLPDLVWCCEVVEHIEEKFVQNIIDTFKNGKIVAMTHALPNQGGYHHVNCKPSEYWIGLMQKNGFEFLIRESFEARRKETKHYFGRTGLIFRNLKLLP